jgi:hypothetical protein
MSSRSRTLGVALCTLVAFAGEAFTLNLQEFDLADVEVQLDRFLERSRDAFKNGEEKEVRAVCDVSDRFAWYEDGELRYPTVDQMLQAKASIPDEMQFETTYSDTDMTVLTDSIASIASRFETKVTGSMAFELSGVVTLLLERDASGWHILQGHTSSKRPGYGR